MQIVFHIGAHCTDDGQLLKCLNRNRRALAQEGIIIGQPGRFRPIFRETISVLDGGPANAEVQEIMLDSIMREDDPQRIIFSNDVFLCGVQKAIDQDALYPEAGEKCLKLFNLFHDQEVEFALAIRNPATFLPACFAKTGAADFEAYIAQVDPLTLRWSAVIERITSALPGVPLKIWSNEDTPFIWYELIREIADHSSTMELIGLDDFLSSIMLPEGLERMEAYLQSHPPANEIQRRRILSAFLDKFEVEDTSLDVEAPGWTRDYVDTLTDLYEEDLFAIERMQGVQFISP